MRVNFPIKSNSRLVRVWYNTPSLFPKLEGYHQYKKTITFYRDAQQVTSLSFIIDSILGKWYDKGEELVQFSKYTYTKHDYGNSRTVYKGNISEILSYMTSEKFKLEEDEDLAFHSLVEKNEKIFHIPMIDFDCDSVILERNMHKVIDLMLDFECNAGIIFSSGRSFHMYLNNLLSPEDWIRFMSRLILMNDAENPNVIDSRWVGHRLLAGYSSLRLTVNSANYISQPSLYCEISITGNRKIHTVFYKEASEVSYPESAREKKEVAIRRIYTKRLKVSRKKFIRKSYFNAS